MQRPVLALCFPGRIHIINCPLILLKRHFPLTQELLRLDAAAHPAIRTLSCLWAHLFMRPLIAPWLSTFLSLLVGAWDSLANRDGFPCLCFAFALYVCTFIYSDVWKLRGNWCALGPRHSSFGGMPRCCRRGQKALVSPAGSHCCSLIVCWRKNQG